MRTNFLNYVHSQVTISGIWVVWWSILFLLHPPVVPWPLGMKLIAFAKLGCKSPSYALPLPSHFSLPNRDQKRIEKTFRKPSKEKSSHQTWQKVKYKRDKNKPVSLHLKCHRREREYERELKIEIRLRRAGGEWAVKGDLSVETGFVEAVWWRGRERL